MQGDSRTRRMAIGHQRPTYYAVFGMFPRLMGAFGLRGFVEAPWKATTPGRESIVNQTTVPSRNV